MANTSRRDLIVRAFLEQVGPLRADELSGLVQTREPGVGRATVYRALRWMVDAGVAKKIDGASGSARYAQAFRRSPPLQPSSAADFVAARDAFRIAAATSEAARAFYSHAAGAVTDLRVRAAFTRLADEERTRLAALEDHQRALHVRDPLLETRPTSHFFRGSATSPFAAGVQELGQGIDTRAALLVAIRCARRSHRFFSKAAQYFADAAARAIVLQFAEVDQTHLDTLVHEYRALQRPQPKRIEPAPVSSPAAGRRQRGRP